MLRRAWAMTVAVTLAGIWPALAAAAERRRGDWELTLSGTGTSAHDAGQNAVGVRAGVGYFLANGLELSLRQTLSYVSTSDFSSTDASTSLALDLHLPLGSDGRWVLYAGGHAGYFYGDSFTDKFEAGPEVGLKFFVGPRTFVYAQVEYQTFFDTGGNHDEADRQFVYTLGVGFRF